MSGLSRALWAEQRDVARACLETPFVRGLADGTLPASSFRPYVAQDAFFLRAFFSAYALAAARAVERLDDARRLHVLMQGVLDELELHARYAESLDIDLQGVEPNSAIRAYTDFLLRTAWSGGTGEILAAMTPCMRLYAWIGQSIAAEVERPDALAQHAYRDWIGTYASDEFEALAVELEVLLDRLASDTPAVRSAYGYAMDCELGFFETHSPETP